jgi:hypothetical protein
MRRPSKVSDKKVKDNWIDTFGHDASEVDPLQRLADLGDALEDGDPEGGGSVRA